MPLSTKGFLTIFVVFLFSCEQKDKAPDTREFAGDKFKENVRSSDARSPQSELKGFKLPEGFEVTLFASEPQIGKPINIAFDARGRMWVTQSFEYPFAAASGKGKDRVSILEDTDGDGVADNVTSFCDTLNIPIGVLPYKSGAVVYSIPNVYFFSDNNNDGRADESRKILGPFKIDDTHGMINNLVRGYDGWIHACHGYANRDTVAGADGRAISMISGNTFRFTPDGSKAEKVTDGRINPFGLVYDERGYQYSTDCHTSPLYQLISNGDYTQWGKQEGMGYAPDMVTMSNEATALAGIAYYGDEFFPENYRSNFYVGDVVRSRVYRYTFNFDGASPVAKREEDFMLSDDPWFRPVDVKMGPDGALYVADFYNSIIGHYEVPLDHPKRDRVRGRIWRITYKGNANQSKLETGSVEKLLEALGGHNILRRMNASDVLADEKTFTKGELEKLYNAEPTPSYQKAHLLWLASRKKILNSDLLNKALNDKDPLLRLHALRIYREQNPCTEGYQAAIKGLSDEDVHVRRAAIEVISRYPRKESLLQAIKFRSSVPEKDAHLVYTVRLCLRTLLRNDSLMSEVAKENWSVEQSKVIADVLMDVPGEDAALFLHRYIQNNSIDFLRAPVIFRHIAQYAPPKYVDSAVRIAMRDNIPDTIQLLAYKGIQQGVMGRNVSIKQVMENWGRKIASSVLDHYAFAKNQSASITRYQAVAVELTGELRIKPAQEKLRQILLSLKKDDFENSNGEVRYEMLDLKSKALEALIKIDNNAGVKTTVSALNDSSTDANFRPVISRVMSNVSPGTLNGILNGAKNIPPDLQANIATSLAGTSAGKKVLTEQVKRNAIMPRTLLYPKVQETWMANATNHEQDIFKKLVADVPPIDTEKEKIIADRIREFGLSNQVGVTTVQEGRIVFTKNCSPCHSISQQGGNVGPNLDGVSQWGPRALAEKILDPNRNISENFKTYTITTKDGKVYSGMYRREENNTLVFADMAGKEFYLEKQQIAKQTPSKFTLMPDSFSQTISQKEFNSLLYFLLNPSK